MHYLKCFQCGQYNEVKSEYLTFCAHCGKKLENNFAAWQRQHPEKSFDDFKLSVCVTESAIAANTPIPSSNPGKKKWLIPVVVIVSMGLFSVIGHWAAKKVLGIVFNQNTPKEMLEGQWINQSYGTLGLKLNAPVVLTKGNLALPDNVKSLIDLMEVYEYRSDKGINIMANSVRYNQVVGAANLEGAANGSINEMKNKPGVTGFDYSTRAIQSGAIPGFRHDGSYSFMGNALTFINVGFAVDLNLWQVIVIFPSNDEVGKQAAERVVGSIQINYPGAQQLSQ